MLNAQRAAAIALRDAGEINDATLRELERELDLEELGWRPEERVGGRRRPVARRSMGRRAPATAMIVLAAAVLACAPAATPAPTESPSPAPSPLAFPRTTGEVVAGRYASDPPFDVPFTFDVPADGWSRCTSTASSSTSAGSPPRSARRRPSAGSPSVTRDTSAARGRAGGRTQPGSGRHAALIARGPDSWRGRSLQPRRSRRRPAGPPCAGGEHADLRRARWRLQPRAIDRHPARDRAAR